MKKKILSLLEEFEKDLAGIAAYPRISESRRIFNKYKIYLEQPIKYLPRNKCVAETAKHVKCKREALYCTVHRNNKPKGIRTPRRMLK